MVAKEGQKVLCAAVAWRGTHPQPSVGFSCNITSFLGYMKSCLMATVGSGTRVVAACWAFTGVVVEAHGWNWAEFLLCASAHFRADLVSVMIPPHFTGEQSGLWGNPEPCALVLQPVRSSLEC